MDNQNILQLIEQKYPVERIQLSNGMPLWPLLRQGIYYKDRLNQLGYSNKLRTKNKWKLLKNFFYGLSYLFKLRRFEFLFFSNADKRVPHQSTLFDIYMDAWSDKLGQEKSLFIEWAIDSHHKKTKVHSANIVSDLPFKLLIAVQKRFTNINIEGGEILESINKDFQLNFDYRNTINAVMAEYKVYSKVFMKIRPKAIFVLSGFTKAPMIFAAKNCGIKVFEPQHGFIGSGHPFYHTAKKFPEFYPDTLIAFGASEKNHDYPSFIFPPNAIIPVGSMQMELIKKQPIPSALQSIIEEYSLTFCVTLQNVQDGVILSSIVNEAQSNKDWLFIIRPKQPDFNLTRYCDESNIILSPEFTTYEVLKASDYNISIFSTTIIEGVFLGAKPILYNIDQLPYKYFDIENSDIAVIEIGDAISETDLQKKGTFGTKYFEEDYFSNVKNTTLCF